VTKIGYYNVNFLVEYSSILKKARVSGASGELFEEKTRGRKSRVRVPFSKKFAAAAMFAADGK
jgi:hypothetical protein